MSTEKPKRRLWVIPVIIAVLIILFLPTPHQRTRYENITKTDLVKFLDCSGTLEGGHSWTWALTDLPSALRVEVNISSTDAVRVYIKTVSGVINDKTQNKHVYTINADGPSMEVKVENPWGLFYNPTAVISGYIKIYHDYTTQVEVVYKTEWLPWWLP